MLGRERMGYARLENLKKRELKEAIGHRASGATTVPESQEERIERRACGSTGRPT